MATQRLSQLHQRILQWLGADHQRTKGFILSSHEELVKALQRDKGTISRSLRKPRQHILSISAELTDLIPRWPVLIYF